MNLRGTTVLVSQDVLLLSIYGNFAIPFFGLTEISRDDAKVQSTITSIPSSSFLPFFLLVHLLVGLTATRISMSELPVLRTPD